MRFIIYALAVYRFTLLLYEETGPFNIFTRIRVLAGISKGVTTVNEETLEYTYTNGSFWAELLNCPYCLSGWISLLAIIGWSTHKLDWLAWWGGVWGAIHLMLKKQGY